MSTLEQLAGSPKVHAHDRGGEEYHFSELTLDAKARLTSLAEESHTPDPLESVKAGLEGLPPPADRRYVAQRSTQGTPGAWPPEISTANGRLAAAGF